MIVIPMAGLSSRFTREGFTKPKYMLEGRGKTLFEHSVGSFSAYFSSEYFLFVSLNVDGVEEFVNERCGRLGIKNYSLIILDCATRGQAETVSKGLRLCGAKEDEQITIFNIDTFRPRFKFPDFLSDPAVDGYLETFVGGGSNWSNILPDPAGDNRVSLTAEKQEISQYCCTGLYFWRSVKLFQDCFAAYERQFDGVSNGGELYVAPMYNLAIKSGCEINYSVIDRSDVIFCGIPSEYKAFLEANVAV